MSDRDIAWRAPLSDSSGVLLRRHVVTCKGWVPRVAGRPQVPAHTRRRRKPGKDSTRSANKRVRHSFLLIQ